MSRRTTVGPVDRSNLAPPRVITAEEEAAAIAFLKGIKVSNDPAAGKPLAKDEVRAIVSRSVHKLHGSRRSK